MFKQGLFRYIASAAAVMLLGSNAYGAIVLELQVIPLSNTDGTKAFNVTSQQFAALVDRVNTVYADTGIQFFFDENADWAPMKNTDLNTDCTPDGTLTLQ
jgi:hypothetical protein